ncbi:MAG: OsmC family protein [Thermoleophilaceae bacterium]
MAGFDVQIRLGDPSSEGIDPAKLTLSHHLTERAEVHAEVMSGGHLLHLAVAGCLFNDILREAGARGIGVTQLEVSADGGFEGDPLLSTGIGYSIQIGGDAPDEELRKLVADVEERAAIPLSIGRGTRVTAGPVEIKPG